MEHVALVTGASAGIGLETARELARTNYRVLIVGRHPARTDAAAESIRSTTGNSRVAAYLADFSSLAEVRRLAHAIRRDHEALHVLVNNAGLWHPERTESRDGFEDTWAVNHLAPFLLTNLLLPILDHGAPARIVNVSSRLHERAAPIDFSDLAMRRGYRAVIAYRRSKLANVVFTRELARRLDPSRITANSLHPGDVSTEVMRENFWANIGIRIARPFLMTPGQGADTSVYLATAPELAGVSGHYFRERRRARENPLAFDTALGRQLWEISAHQVDLSGTTVDVSKRSALD